jgi:hypothetical protein
MTRGKAAAITGVLALIGLCACGSVEQQGRSSTVTASAPTSTPTTTRTDPMRTTPTGPPEDLTAPPTRAGKNSKVRMKGTVSDGVEPGCTLLTSKGVVYLLMWRSGTLVTGQEIEVEGTLQPDLVTTCQQGTPLLVERVLSPKPSP